MSNYTEKIKPFIIKAVEIGEFSISQIAKTYHVSRQFVKQVMENYDGFYSDLKEGYKQGFNKRRRK